MESALSSALARSGRIVDLAYAALVHQLGITQRFFPQVRLLGDLGVAAANRRRFGARTVWCIDQAAW